MNQKIRRVLHDCVDALVKEGMHGGLRNTRNGRVPHIRIDLPDNVISLCFFYKKREFRVFNQYNIFDKPQTVWVFKEMQHAIDFIKSDLSDETNLVYSYTK